MPTSPPPHPRIFVTAEAVPDLARACDRDDWARQAWQQVLARCDGILRERSAGGNGPGPRAEENILWLAFAHLVAPAGGYGRGAAEEALAICQRPSWGDALGLGGEAELPWAEAAVVLAVGYDWLHDPLEEGERAAIREALVTQALDRYATAVSEGDLRSGPMSRRAVASGAASVAAIALLGEAEQAERTLSLAQREMDVVLDAMPGDGGWPEGLSDWRRGVTYLAYQVAALESALGEGLDVILRDAVRNTGYFGLYFTGPDGLATNFAECMTEPPDTATLHYLARRTGRLELSAFRDRRAREAHPFDLLWRDPRAAEVPLTNHSLCPSRAFREVHWAALRSTWDDDAALYLAAKAGDLGVHGSHLDLGTFVLVARGERFARDLGPGECSTAAHNTLLVQPGGDQGRGAAGTITDFIASRFLSAARLDCSRAFGERLRAWSREALLIHDSRTNRHAGDYVVLIDEVMAAEDAVVEWRLHTSCVGEAMGTRVRLAGDRADLCVDLVALAAEPVASPLPDDHRKLPTCATATADLEAAYLMDPDPHILARATARPRMVLFAVLYPLAKGEAGPEVQGIAAEGVAGVSVRRGDLTDRLLINVRGAGGAEAAGIHFEGHQAFVRRCDPPGEEGAVTHAVLRDGLSIAADRGLMLGAQSVCTVVLDQSELRSTGRCTAWCRVAAATGIAFTTWAEAVSVLVNGRAVESESVGGMVGVALPSAGEHMVEVEVAREERI